MTAPTTRYNARVTDRRKIFLLLFFFSGGSALIYEVAWTRQFTPIIGNTVFSVSAILAVFMAGLALGSRIFGRLIDLRPINLIKTYALLEAGIALYSLALPFFLRVADPIFEVLYLSTYDSFIALSLGRLMISIGLLIFPATLMGGTLPILIRYYTENIDSVGLHVGRVYTVNIWGAAIGTAAAGFVLIPFAGVRVAVLFAVAVNLLVAAVAWFLASPADPLYKTEQSKPNPSAGSFIVLIAMFLSGFAALVNEVAWTRVFALIVGPTTYAFTLMLIAMIVGLGLGAWLGSKWATNHDSSLISFAWIEVGVGLSSLGLVPLFGELPLWVGLLVRRYVESFATIQSIEFLIFFLILLVPTTLLGATFPIAAKLYASSNSLLGSEVSAVYAANTLGGILGSLIAGFLLVPLLGSQHTLIFAACVSVTVGVLILARSFKETSVWWAKPILMCAAISVVPISAILPRWDAELMSSGAYRYAPYYGANLDLESVLKRGDLLYFREGTTTTVSVKRDSESTKLAVDGKIDATDSGDMLTQKMLAHLPMLLSENPKKIANIGLGSGVTAGAALRYPIEKLDIIEISPEVVEASKFFKHVNYEVLEDPRVELIIGDGRNHLRYTPTKYDVIISEPSNPWMSGMGSLFTREFFKESRNHLSENGIHCQWLHSYNMSTDDIRTVVLSFRSAFPFVSLWALNENDFLLLGSPSPIQIRDDIVRANFQLVKADLSKVGVQDLYSILSLYLIADEDLDRFAQGAIPNTDDFPVLEFRAPKFIYANTADENLTAILGVKREVPIPLAIAQSTGNPTAVNHRHKAEMFLFAGSYERAAPEFQKALRLDYRDKKSWTGLLQTARGRARLSVTNFIEEMIERHPEPFVLLAAAEHYQVNFDYSKATTLVRSVLETNPENIAALEKLSDLFAEEANLELASTVDVLLGVDPDNARGLFHQATILQYQGRFDEAIEVVGRSINADPTNMRTRNLLAILYTRTFQYDRAAASFLDTLDINPLDPISHNNYGFFLLARGRYEDAVRLYMRAIDLDPENIQGFIGVGEALRQSGQSRAATTWYRKALRLSPGHPIASMHVDE